MLGLVKSCIGTKFTGQFGDLIAVSIYEDVSFFALKTMKLTMWMDLDLHWFYPVKLVNDSLITKIL